MTDHAGPRGYECNPLFIIVSRKICNLVLKFHNPMSKSTKRHIGGHNLSSGYAILVPGYKFRECQFEIPGYTCTVGGRRGLSYTVLNFERH